MGANKAFCMLLLSFVVALVGLGTVFFKTVPLLLSHAVYVCQETFSNILFGISHSVPLVLITLVIMVLLIGLVTLLIQVLKTRNYLKKHMRERVPIPSSLIEITKELGLNDSVDVVKDRSKFSFCYGLIHPRICLSTGLLRSLNTRELKAVILHESYHVKNRDPLKIILGKTASLMFFFIPLLKDIQNFYALSKEIAADKLVVGNGYRHSLISVLSKLLVAGSSKFSGVAALASLDDLERRILLLTGNQKRSIFKPSLLNISMSAFVVLFSLALMNTPAYAVSDHEGSMESSMFTAKQEVYFICPFGDKCALSCKAKEEEGGNYSQDLMYTPMHYTPK
ncbi:M48 family metalloprotease [Candidatus Daviesbacteria bacterium]|nr:M48 family metalloprotease [Candidatus Daviesbacteria bacterium]